MRALALSEVVSVRFTGERSSQHTDEVTPLGTLGWVESVNVKSGTLGQGTYSGSRS